MIFSEWVLRHALCDGVRTVVYVNRANESYNHFKLHRVMCLAIPQRKWEAK